MKNQFDSNSNNRCGEGSLTILDYYHQYLVKRKLCPVFSFLLFIPFPGGKHNCLPAKSKYKLGKILQTSAHQS